MSELDIKALEANFEGWRSERAPDLSKSDAFERYSIELIFRDLDPSDDEIDAGWTGSAVAGGGGDDGGLDGIYFVVNRRFMPDDYKMPDDVLGVELHLIQAKNETGFSEHAVTKMQVFIDDLLSYSKPVDSFSYYSQKVKDRMSAIREMYESIIGKPHTFTLKCWYATKGDQDPNPKVVQRAENLKERVKAHVSSAIAHFEFWGARNLTSAFRNPPNKIVVLDIGLHFMCPDGSVVCLARLDNLAKFLTDTNGHLREYILEPNVRDYAGPGNPVNRDIRDTLANSDIKEFWWLNNGITILADDCTVGAGKAQIDSPELVNGLQTSHEIFNFFSSIKKPESRSVLVRIILPPTEQTRRRIIKATNYQTPVNQLSLRATEDIHFDIEELLKLYDLFYDRRKGQYRRLRKPISRIIGIKELAQSVMSIALQQPDGARARPLTMLGTDDGYNAVFDVKVSRDMFLSCVLLDRQVWAYLNTETDLSKDTKNDLRFYADMCLSSLLAKKAAPTKADIAGLASVAKNAIAPTMLAESYARVLSIYSAQGATARAAKGGEMTNSLKAELKKMFP